MAEITGVQWADSTWNPIRGCRKVSPGCQYCYMFRDQARWNNDPNVVVRASDKTFYAPLKWQEPKFVFTCSWGDFFIDETKHEADLYKWRDDAWEVIKRTPQHTYLILTKRPKNIPNMLPSDWGPGWKNVWFGVSIENDAYYGRVNMLKKIPCALRFISYEPALGPINMPSLLLSGEIGWVISGGESGPKARVARMDWFKQARDACRLAGVPYFHKQHGGTVKVHGAWGGNLLDGSIWNLRPHRQAGKALTQGTFFVDNDFGNFVDNGSKAKKKKAVAPVKKFSLDGQEAVVTRKLSTILRDSDSLDGEWIRLIAHSGPRLTDEERLRLWGIACVHLPKTNPNGKKYTQEWAKAYRVDLSTYLERL